MKLLLALSPALLLAGCLNWQGTYDSAARRECQKEIDNTARKACLESVARNATERNASRRD